MDMDSRFENFTVTVLRLNKLVQKIKLHEMEEFGLKAIHVMCIYYLFVRSDGLTATEMVRLTLEDKAAVSRAIAHLKEKWYAECGDKKYNARIKLTPEGEKVARYINDKAEKAVVAGGCELTEDARKNMYASLNSIADNLKRYYERLSGGKADTEE